MWKYFDVTYREAIQDIQRRIDEINADVNGLRDFASSDEKKYFNELRTRLFEATTIFSPLDDGMSIDRAGMLIRRRNNESE